MNRKALFVAGLSVLVLALVVIIGCSVDRQRPQHADSGRVTDTGEGGTVAPPEHADRRALIRGNLNEALESSQDALARTDFVEAQRRLQAARVARNQDPMLFHPDEIREFDARIADTQQSVEAHQREYERALAMETATAARREAGEAAPLRGHRQMLERERSAITPRRPGAAAAGEVRGRDGEELWVIEKPQQPAAEVAPGEDAVPGSGALMAKLADQPEQQVPVPLKHTDVKSAIAGYIATTDVTQQFHNPFESKIEAVYVFPLPHNAAINEFVMTIGERRIRGIIREREEAQRIYHEARSQGHVASLLSQERPNIFTQSVANIEPGKQIDIHIRYFHTLTYSDGWYEYAFPMVVGPRFNPSHITDGIGAVGRGAAGASGQKTEVQYLRPGERSGHDIALAVELDAGVMIESLESVNHNVVVRVGDGPENRLTARRQVIHPPGTFLDDPNQWRWHVQLAADDAIPNKDFVLRYRVAGETLKTAMMTHRDESGGYFTLMLYPPAEMKRLPEQPLELVFTLDVSGSMSGKPIEQAKAAVRHALKQLTPADTFQVIRFASGAERLSERAIPATPENVRAALAYVEQMSGGGGTHMLEGITASLDRSADDPQRLRFVAFLTDGYIGNEREILAEINRRIGNARIFSFGVGSSPNRYLMDHMAKIGQGAAAYLSLNDDGAQVMDDFLQRIRRPAMTHISIDWGELKVSDMYPQRIGDLFVGKPLILTGRMNGDAPTTLRIRGKIAGEMSEIALPVTPSDGAAKHPALAAVWARAKIADLGDRSIWENNPDLPNDIRQTALSFGLMSAYTSFVAVDSATRTAGDFGTTIAVPVPVPDGVRYETTVQE